MHDLSFAETVRPRTPIILRLPMLPYSVGHEILLLNQQNTLLFDPQIFNQLPLAAQKLAIIRAALVCYRTWKQNQQIEKHLRLWGWLIRRSNWAAEIAEFRNYRTVGSSFPPSPTQENYEIAAGVDKEERGRELGGSYMARLVTFLSRGGLYRSIGYETPWDVPFGMANYLYLSDLEMDGAARIENARETTVRLEIEQHHRDIEEEKEKSKIAWKSCSTQDERIAALKQYPRILNLFPDSADLLKPIWESAQDDERRKLVQKFPTLIELYPEAAPLLFQMEGSEK